MIKKTYILAFANTRSVKWAACSKNLKTEGGAAHTLLIKKFISRSLLILFISMPLFAQANDYASASAQGGVAWGVKLTQLNYNNDNFYAATIPTNEYLRNLFVDGLFLYTNTNFTWGFTDFFFDFGMGSGLRYYPLGNDYISLYAGAEAATFFFNNVTLTPKAGIDFDFPLDNDSSTYIGGEILTRQSFRLAEFIEDDHWFISSNGWSINGGIRTRFSFFEQEFDNTPETL